MALQVDISGITQVYFGGQGVLNAVVTDTETGQTPAGLQYAWTAAEGSFVGATTARVSPITLISPGTPTNP